MEIDIYTPASFSPKEAEGITGLTTVMQRDWRRRGFIESQSGRAKFDPFEVATIWIAKMLADRGIGPSVSKDIAQICGAGLVAYALEDFDCWEGDHEDALSWTELPPQEPLDPEIVAILEAKGVDPNARKANWGTRAKWLTKQVLQRSGFSMKPAPYFAWYPNGSHNWAAQPQDFFQESSFEEKYHGPVIILDFSAIGGEFGDRCKRPLFHVEFERDESGKITPQIEYGTPVKFAMRTPE